MVHHQGFDRVAGAVQEDMVIGPFAFAWPWANASISSKECVSTGSACRSCTRQVAYRPPTGLQKTVEGGQMTAAASEDVAELFANHGASRSSRGGLCDSLAQE